MKKYSTAVNSLFLRNLTILFFVLLFGCPNAIQAQGDGARFYWKGLVGTNAIPVIGNSMGGNANPMDPSYTVVPGSDFTATMSMAGYAKMLPLFKRSAFISVLVPMGRISSTVSLNELNS